MRKFFLHHLWAVLLPLATTLALESHAAGRNVSAVDMSLHRGETNRLAIVLEAQGDETGVNFSLCFDPSLVTFIDAVRGGDATNANAVLTPATGQAGSGRIGISLLLPQVFDSPGSKVIAEVLFQGAVSTTNISALISFCDQP